MPVLPSALFHPVLDTPKLADIWGQNPNSWSLGQAFPIELFSSSARLACLRLFATLISLLQPKSIKWHTSTADRYVQVPTRRMFCQAGGREQPFYQVLVDGRDRADSTTYVAECNIEVRSFNYDPQWKGQHQLTVHHEKVRRMA